MKGHYCILFTLLSKTFSRGMTRGNFRYFLFAVSVMLAY